MPAGAGGVRQPELHEPNQLPAFSEALAVASVMLLPSTARRVLTAVNEEDEDLLVIKMRMMKQYFVLNYNLLCISYQSLAWPMARVDLKSS